jgi:hypothetical protein
VLACDDGGAVIGGPLSGAEQSHCLLLLRFNGMGLVSFQGFFAKHSTDVDIHVYAHTLTLMNAQTHTIPL